MKTKTKTKEIKPPRTPVAERAMLILQHELAYAKKKHPVFPIERSYALSIIGEEYGEACQVNNDIRTCSVPYDEGISHYIQEVAHIGATAIRAIETAIEHLDKLEDSGK